MIFVLPIVRKNAHTKHHSSVLKCHGCNTSAGGGEDATAGNGVASRPRCVGGLRMASRPNCPAVRGSSGCSSLWDGYSREGKRCGKNWEKWKIRPRRVRMRHNTRRWQTNIMKEHDSLHTESHVKNLCVQCVRGAVYCLRLPSRACESLLCVSEIFETCSALTSVTILYMTTMRWKTTPEVQGYHQIQPVL